MQICQHASPRRPTKIRNSIWNDIGALLITARVSKGWKQKELARRLPAASNVLICPVALKKRTFSFPP
jgi:ribosome-binding protein aMBF1 (putative translation factor)